MAASLILGSIWILAHNPALTHRGVRALGAAGTIAASLAYALMVLTMPLAGGRTSSCC
jgi:hypothetical protein